MSRTSYIYLYICIAAPNAVRPKKRIQRERKSSASQCLKGAPLKLVILKPPPCSIRTASRFSCSRKGAVQEWRKGACRYTVNRAESGVGDSVPFFVRIGEKGSRNLLRSDLWSLAVPGRMSLCVLDTVEENAYRQCGKRAGPSVLRRIRSPSSPCRAEPRAPVAAARPNAFWSKLHRPSICRAEGSEIARRAAAHPRIGRPGAGRAACLAFRLPPSRLAEAQ